MLSSAPTVSSVARENGTLEEGGHDLEVGPVAGIDLARVHLKYREVRLLSSFDAADLVFHANGIGP